MNAWSGESVAPVSLKRIARILVTNAAGPAASTKLGFGSVSCGNLPDAFQSNLPPSTITPPILVPCPPMNLVAEWITISAPCSNGLKR